MIEIQLEDRIIEVKEELTISQYQMIHQYKEIYISEPAKLLAMYLDISVNELKDLPLEQVQFVENYLTDILAVQEMKDELFNSFTFEGVEYGLENDWSKLSWGAWTDLEVYSSKDIEQNIHKIMAILYRPVLNWKGKKFIIDRYRASEIEERAELFKKLPAKYWFGVCGFFLLVSTVYINNLKNSLSSVNRANQLIEKGWKILPKWIKRMLPLDSILISHTTLQKKT
jgi:hypothetical protein